MRDSAPLAEAILDSLPQPACLVDALGRVVASNHAWQDATRSALGAYALESLVRAIALSERESLELEAGVRAVLDGERVEFELVVAGHGAAESRWFATRGAAVEARAARCMLTCEDVTARRRAEAEFQRLRAALEASADALMVFDGRRMLPVEANQAACRMFGRPRAALSSVAAPVLFGTTVSGLEAQWQALLADDEASATFETRTYRADGVALLIEARCRALRVGADWFVVMTARDISARRQLENMREQQSLQQELLARLGQLALENPSTQELAAFAVDVVREGLDVELCRYLEFGSDDRVLVQTAGVGWQPSWLEPSHFDAAVETEDRFVLGARESVVVDDYQMQTQLKPSPIQVGHGVRSSVEALVCGAGGIYGVIGAYAREPGRFSNESANFVLSVSHTLAASIERRHSEDRLTYMAQFDGLTGLPNRNMYLDRLGHTLVEAARDRLPVAVLFVDIDRFKAVNDTLGHALGDAVLVQIAERLRAAVRPGDTVGRLSGDEFAIALAHLARDDDAGMVAQKIVDQMSAPFLIEGTEVYVSASVGISVYPIDSEEPDTLLKKADTAMYRAKESGRNGYQFYLPKMHERATERLHMESRLRRALDRGEYELMFQPKVNLANGEISGLEALLRWNCPEEGLLHPARFIPVLEDTGLIVAVGEWVVSSVCLQIRRWQDEGIQAKPVAVNLSARQFRQQNLDAIVGILLAQRGIDPSLLEFELTESVLMSDSESAVETLRRMKARGIRLSVDDFGTGYSSLTYLKQFPLDALKIDRAFIRDVSDDPDDATIVVAIINLAHSLKLRVVAEGVETEAQLAFLREHACDEVQGYLFGRPMPAEEIARVLRNATLRT